MRESFLFLGIEYVVRPRLQGHESTDVSLEERKWVIFGIKVFFTPYLTMHASSSLSILHY